MAAKEDENEPLIIVILGCTGTGKSKLSIEIGRRIGGEIISADSMQVYKGLDIITNKVTAEERGIVPHHLLDFVEANEHFSVVEFKTIALETISDIVARQKVPIIVGGTNYYIESLLWDNLINEKNQVDAKSVDARACDLNTPNTFVNCKSSQSESEADKVCLKYQQVGDKAEGLQSSSLLQQDQAWRGDICKRDKRGEKTVGRHNSDLGIKYKEHGSLADTMLEENHKKQYTPDEKGAAGFNSETQEKSLGQKSIVFASSERLKGEEVAHQYEGGRKVMQKLKEIEGDSLDIKYTEQEVLHTTTISEMSLHQQLAKVDFTMAQKLHPKDTRKIKRSLQVYEQSGMTHSEHIALQQSQEGSSGYSGPMRFKNVCVLWLQCQFETLDKRLDARVDQMIEQGLVEELVEFYKSWKSNSPVSKMQNNEGIFQSIGFKEFRQFLEGENYNLKENAALFGRCVEAMKCATRRYARKQVRWVNNRFLGRPSSSSPDVYGLDATDLESWDSNVLEKGLDILKSFTAGEKASHVPLDRILLSEVDKHANHTCHVCNGRIIIGDQNWTAHLRSRSHRHYKKKQDICRTDSISHKLGEIKQQNH